MGLRFARLARGAVVDHVFGALEHGRGGWIATLNLDYVRRCVAEPDTAKRLSEADLVVADGIPLLWAARLKGTPLPDRVAGSDLVWLLAERAAQEGRSLYLLGGSPGVAKLARERLESRWPGLQIAGVSSPRISLAPTPEELASVQSALESARPDLVYVALGAPKEERLISSLRASLTGLWWIGVGVSLSFMSGEIRRAPGWMQTAGLEWLHRLAQEPRRLARRYLLDDLPFAVRLLATSWRARRAPSRGNAGQSP
jgi:N-acetylglucosaminyldiphosphoundecaprenol N-acetyl-beta-D-mannosaminyltransferase